MYLLLIWWVVPLINAFITTQIHRNAIYRHPSPCAFLGNISLPSYDASLHSCIWKCVNEYDCQTAIYFKDGNICSMFAELCESGSIESSGTVLASVICYRKDHGIQFFSEDDA